MQVSGLPLDDMVACFQFVRVWTRRCDKLRGPLGGHELLMQKCRLRQG
ncbi:hypothetical protein [Streptomyces sp. NPDC001652]